MNGKQLTEKFIDEIMEELYIEEQMAELDRWGIDEVCGYYEVEQSWINLDLARPITERWHDTNFISQGKPYCSQKKGIVNPVILNISKATLDKLK